MFAKSSDMKGNPVVDKESKKKIKKYSYIKNYLEKCQVISPSLQHCSITIHSPRQKLIHYAELSNINKPAPK